MTTIDAIIIDDEISCTESLSLELGMYCPQVQVVACCHSAAEGLAAIIRYKPDLIFLDIEMPRMNGFEMLRQLNEINFDVIFVTAYDQFAMKAIKFSASDYLLKPIVFGDLISAVDKVEQRIIKNTNHDHLEAVLANVNYLYNNLNAIAIPTSEGIEFITHDEILYCEAQVNYTLIHKANQRPLLISKTLKEIESMLEHFPFIRIHQSYLININYLSKYVRGSGGYVVLKNGTQLPVSRAKKEDFLQKFGK
jgi:two-component system LytT family response regulator